MTERSTYEELRGPANYIELSDEELFSKALHFANIEQCPGIMPRVRSDAHKILGRITFEIMSRDGVSVVEK